MRILPRLTFRVSRSSSGFTLVELALYSAMFSVAAVAFVSILVSLTRVQVRQGAVGEVNQQSQFLLQNIQRYVESSSLVEMSKDSPTSTLKLRMTSSTFDPTYIYLSGNTVYLKETDSGTPQALTSNKVLVSNLIFIKRSNPPGKDSVNLSFTMDYNASNIQQKFSQALNISVARVSAATFDSNIVPASKNTYKIGSTGDWQSINDTIYFNSDNVGIGVTPPLAKLHVAGGDIYVDSTSNKGLILRDNVGGCWRITVNTSGTISSASLTCP